MDSIRENHPERSGCLLATAAVQAKPGFLASLGMTDVLRMTKAFRMANVLRPVTSEKLQVDGQILFGVLTDCLYQLLCFYQQFAGVVVNGGILQQLSYGALT
jgi:hypothetical protein